MCGPYEALRIAAQARAHIVQLSLKGKTILRGLRRNCMLSYRPSLWLSRLARSDSQAWAQGEDMAEGSHRAAQVVVSGQIQVAWRRKGPQGCGVEPLWAHGAGP